MNKRYTALAVLLIACLGSIQAFAGQKLRVFFIGNSYTYYNDLPKMVADIAASMGDTLVYDSHTVGGYTLKAHWSNFPGDPCISKIKTGNWDYVVLQEQSQLPAYAELSISHPTYVYARQFANLIRDSAVCTTPMFYMTWGYKNGDASNCPGLPYMCTYEGMDSVLRLRYMQLADSFDAVVSPVGAVRRYIRQNHPGIELYTSDGSHPEVAGTYAAACAFYTALFKKDPSLATFNSTLPATDAVNIKTAAKTVVYDSLSQWGLGVYDLSAAYVHNISGTQVTFTNNSSLKAQTYSWNFGDGNTSTLKDPVHTYSSKGDYTVTLTAYNAIGCSRVVSKTLTLPLSVSELKNGLVAITPNPAIEYITIQTGRQLYNIRITNAIGQAVYEKTINSSGAYKIDVSAFSSGVYYITGYNDTGMLYHGKFVKQ